MYRLLALGGLVLERDGAPLDDVVRNRKALALLAALAVHGGLGRERITALLWPESDADRAKGSLNQAVHMLRRRLAEPELFLGTAELRLNPARIDSDVGLFTRAVGDGDLETAVAFYRGPFLEGVHLEGTPEFERWADERRAELGARYGQALETLALEAEARSDPRAAVEWWRRLQATDPYSTRVALRLMRALEAAGDPAAALRHARAHETLLRDELGIPPDPAIAERVARLRSTPTAEIVALAGEIAAGNRGLATSPGEVAIPSGEARTQAGALAARRAGRRLAVPLAVLTLLALAAGVALVAGVAGRANGGGGSAGPVSLVVLPFVDLSPDGDQEYFADGITEEILNSLAGIRELRVPARTTSFYFKGRALPVTEIAALLGVDAVLEGSVRRSGDRLRITAQLVDARDDRHLWSETFDRDVGDVFSVQEAIARTVAEALRVRLVDPEGVAVAPPAPSPAAHDLHLRGLFHWNRRSPQDLGLAVELLEQATRLDPDYARPWAALALAYAVIPIAFTQTVPQEEAWARMEAAAERALALDPTLAEAHAARALGYHFQWRWDDAEREFRRALAVDPDHAIARQWYGEHLAKTGRGPEGVAEMRRALELDPLSLVIHNDLGLVLMLDRQFPEAAAQWERTLALDPGFAIPHFFLHRLHLMEGRLDAAEDAGRRWAELSGAMPVAAVVTLSRAPADPVARQAALELLGEWERGPTPRWLDLAFYYTRLGETDAAFRALEQGLRAGAPMMAQVGASPWLDPLRGDRRMERIVEAVGLR
jgi:TolB-like protein/DNA-binding SARP family transcriptional activator/Flp pilus assembly protein TadD